MKFFLFQEIATKHINGRNPNCKSSRNSYKFCVDNQEIFLSDTVYTESTDILIYGSLK